MQRGGPPPPPGTFKASKIPVKVPEPPKFVSTPENTGALIVLDNGCHTTKAGFACEDTPRLAMPSLFGKPRYRDVMERHVYIGQEAIKYRGVVQFTHGADEAVPCNIDELERMWYVFLQKSPFVFFWLLQLDSCSPS